MLLVIEIYLAVHCVLIIENGSGSVTKRSAQGLGGVRR